MFDRRGSVAIMVAVLAAVLIAFASLAVEIELALRTQRQMQLAADDAAMAATSALVTGSPQNWQQEGYGAADANGFGGSNWNKPPDCLSIGTASLPWIFVGTPPCDGPHTGNSNYVEAFLEMSFPLRLARVVFGNNFVLHGRAVATTTSLSGCVAVLDPVDNKSFWINGSSVSATLQGCDIFVDSNANNAAVTSGNPTLVCDTMYVGGTSNPNPITLACPTVQNAQPIGDPYSQVQVPSSPSCSTATAISVKNATQIIQPNCYTGLAAQGSGATLDLCPGTYVVSGSNGVSVTAHATMQSLSAANDTKFTTDCPQAGAGVTIVLTGSSAANVGTVTFQSGAIVNLTAQNCTGTNCTVNGVPSPQGIPSEMLFFQDRLATTSTCQGGGKNQNNFIGGAQQTLSGILYFPQGCVNYQGSNTSTATCFEIVSWNLSLSGNALLNASLCGQFTKKIEPVLLAE